MSISTVMGINKILSIAKLYDPEQHALTFANVGASSSSTQTLTLDYSYALIHEVHIDQGSNNYTITIYQDSAKTEKVLELTGTSVPDAKTNCQAFAYSDTGELYIEVTNNDSSAATFELRILVGMRGEDFQ